MDTAIILAGGKSSRMGFDKQFIQIDGIYLTEYIIQLLKPLFSNIILVTNKPGNYNLKEIIIAEDQYKDFGPLGGIHAGLKSSKSLYNYVIACDMPYINRSYIEYMKKKLSETNYKNDAVITKLGNWIEPFNGFYSRSLIPLIEEKIVQNDRKISNMLDLAKVLYIEEKTARLFSPDWNMFTNLNTEEDLDKLKNLRAGV